MRVTAGLAIALMLGLTNAQAQTSPEAKSVEQIVAKLYQGYRPGGDPEDSAKALPFDASLQALVKKVEQTNSEGVGFDPFCACQDYELTNVVVKATDVTPQTATVVARFNNFGEATQVVFKLAMTPKGWAIHDMILPEAPSFRNLLVEATKP